MSADKPEKIRVVELPADAGEQPEVSVGADETYGPDQVAPGRKVRMHFSLALADVADAGPIEDTFGREPVEFTVGDGNLLPGFEQAICGLRPGDQQSVRLPGERAFGAYNEDNLRRYPRYQFPADLVLEAGLMINFSDVGGHQQPGVVREFDADEVLVDFNHPLAGRDILFTVEIIAVHVHD